MAGKTTAPAGGVLPQREKGYVSVRVMASGGLMTAEEMEAVARTARTFGRGYTVATARLNVEIPWVRREDVPAAAAMLAAAGLFPGSTGPTVRSVVVCKGDFCRHGLCDVRATFLQIDREQAGRLLPRKLKIGISGCPNNCMKVQFNDIGLMGQAYPVFDAGACTSCGACTGACREGAVRATEEGIVFSPDRCVGCGRCIAVCREGAVAAEKTGFAVFLGGRAGRHLQIGRRLDELVPFEAATAYVGEAIAYYADHAEKGERFGEMMRRIGEDAVCAALAPAVPHHTP
jgi:dissimilatory sulfite reductase (desulfoviridin) alpha/beta subunit